MVEVVDQSQYTGSADQSELTLLFGRSGLTGTGKMARVVLQQCCF